MLTIFEDDELEQAVTAIARALNANGVKATHTKSVFAINRLELAKFESLPFVKMTAPRRLLIGNAECSFQPDLNVPAIEVFELLSLEYFKAKKFIQDFAKFAMVYPGISMLAGRNRSVPIVCLESGKEAKAILEKFYEKFPKHLSFKKRVQINPEGLVFPVYREIEDYDIRHLLTLLSIL